MMVIAAVIGESQDQGCKSELRLRREPGSKLNIHPRTLLQLDAFGAGLTALTTFFLLAGERINTGLPSESLVAMSVVAASFLCFDIVALLLAFRCAHRLARDCLC